MAKKAKKRLAKTKRIAKPVRRTRMNSVDPTVLNSARLLIIAAGIIILVAGAIYTFFGYKVNGLVTETWFALANFVLGILMLLMLTALKRKPRAAAAWTILFALVALIIPPFGFIVGPVLALIAGILVLVKFNVY